MSDSDISGAWLWHGTGESVVGLARRCVTTLRIDVEPDNERAYRLYRHLGYRTIGESEASWEAERSDGSRLTYRTKIVEMSKLARGAR